MPGDTVAAGWYPDPGNPAVNRWWDGTQWGPQTQPAPNFGPPGQPMAGTAPLPQASTERGPTEPESKHRFGLFGGKKEAEAEVARLQGILDSLGVTERDALQSELAGLRQEVPALATERDQLLAAVEPLRTQVASLEAEKSQLDSVRAEVQQLGQQRVELQAEVADLQQSRSQLGDVKSELDQLKSQVVETRETAILQEVGIYQYRHPLDDSPAYKAKLTGIQAQTKDMVKAGSAVQGSTTWTVNGSAREGTRMVKEFSKLMLRAYNNEAESIVRMMKPYTLDSSIARLEKARATISKLGQTMNIRVTDNYHQLRLHELELTADYLAKVAEEKERDREERARLREEAIAQREIEREQERLRKELAHYQNTLAAMQAQGDREAAARAQAKVAEINDSIDGITKRAANIRAGHVYVISNEGAFGPKMVKIGMTRRLEPMDRIRELGDASVPFHYDVHGIVFSDDAVGLETHLHHELQHCRVNWVNMRREFFLADPSEVKEILERSDVDLISWVDHPEALEWHQSENAREEFLAKESSVASDHVPTK